MSSDNKYTNRYDYLGNIKFELNESPNWRQNSEAPNLTTSAQLSDIVDFYKRYGSLPQAAKNFNETTFVKVMSVAFVLNANVGESVGTQTEAGTRAVIEDYMRRRETDEQGSSGSGRQESERVTINVYETLTRFFKLHEEMKNTGTLTVQIICDFHRVLMDNIHKESERAGKIRLGDAYVTWNDDHYVYPKPMQAEQMFYACIDHHTRHMKQYERLAESGPSVESFSYLFRCAASLLFDFVDAHPFDNGNGRMCRLLANYVMTLITPFPVALYSSTGSGRSGRRDYVNAIVECRNNRKMGPGTLAAMLIEGTWRGWNNLFRILADQNLLDASIPIGPIVVNRSDNLQQKKDKITSSFERFHVEVQSDEVDTIIEKINGANVSADDLDDFDSITVTLGGNIVLKVHVYN